MTDTEFYALPEGSKVAIFTYLFNGKTQISYKINNTMIKIDRLIEGKVIDSSYYRVEVGYNNHIAPRGNKLTAYNISALGCFL